MFDDLGIIIRTLLILLFLLFITRILGRRTLSELTFYDFVFGLVMGNIAATVITEENFGMQNGLLVLTISAIWILAINMLTLKSVPARKILEAEPIIAIHSGKILEENLKKRYYNINDLLEMLRENGIFDPNQVEIAVIEADGKLSLLEKQNIQISKQTQTSTFAGSEIIIDGVLIDEGLAKSGLTLEQFKEQLKQKGITNFRDVTVAMLTPEGEFYVDKRCDNNTDLKSDIKQNN